MGRTKINITDIIGLFQTDDGSLPDIYVENLKPNDVEHIYHWVLAQTSTSGKLECIELKTDQTIHVDYFDAIQLHNRGIIQVFRHSLEGLKINGHELPCLTFALEGNGEFSFDYRMGDEWTIDMITSLFDFLSHIKILAPYANIFRCDEGSYDNPNEEFNIAFETYYLTNKQRIAAQH